MRYERKINYSNRVFVFVLTSFIQFFKNVLINEFRLFIKIVDVFVVAYEGAILIGRKVENQQLPPI